MDGLAKHRELKISVPFIYGIYQPGIQANNKTHRMGNARVCWLARLLLASSISSLLSFSFLRDL